MQLISDARDTFMRVVVTHPHCRGEITGLVGESDVAVATDWPVAKMVS